MRFSYFTDQNNPAIYKSSAWEHVTTLSFAYLNCSEFWNLYVKYTDTFNFERWVILADFKPPGRVICKSLLVIRCSKMPTKSVTGAVSYGKAFSGQPLLTQSILIFPL